MSGDMIHKTRGIVLHSVKYGETSLIAHVYTEAFGSQSYLLKGIRSPRSRMKPALFRPLALLEMVVYKSDKQTLQHVREVHLAIPYKSLDTDIRKSSIALFLTELIWKSIRMEESYPELFGYLWNTFPLLDSQEENLASFHLVFAVGLCRYLGFQPQQNRSDSRRFFQLREGSFQAVFHPGTECLDETESIWFSALMETQMDRFSTLVIPPGMRGKLLEKLLLYYRLHLPGFPEIRSHAILHILLS